MNTTGPFTPRHRPALVTVVLIAVALIASMIVAAGCAANQEPELRSSAIELSDALAFRDGEPSITIVRPSDGSLVVSPITLRVDAENLRLRSAGATKDGEGHLHILIDEECKSVGVVIESGSNVIDLNDGRSETQLDLEPGQYEICVQVADGFHSAVAIVDRISISVLDPEDFGFRPDAAAQRADSLTSG